SWLRARWTNVLFPRDAASQRVRASESAACRTYGYDVAHRATVTALEITIQVLTCSALVGLLGAVGLRLTYGEVKAALKRCRFTAILVVNFALIPALAVVIVKAFALEGDVIIAMGTRRVVALGILVALFSGAC